MMRFTDRKLGSRGLSEYLITFWIRLGEVVSLLQVFLALTYFCFLLQAGGGVIILLAMRFRGAWKVKCTTACPDALLVASYLASS